MRPNYLDRGEKATALPGMVVVPEPSTQEDIRRTLRQAFVAPEPGNDWDALLAKIR